MKTKIINIKYYYMYKRTRPRTTSIKLYNVTEGETIEQKIRRILTNKEPITDGAPLVFTDRKDGVKPEFDIRTDRFELAVEAMDLVTKQHLSKREERLKAIKGGAEKGSEGTPPKTAGGES